MVTQKKLECLLKQGRILENINGGFMTWNTSFVEKESIITDHFPQYCLKEIKVSKWPAGKHFYTTINGSSISINGQTKWNTEQEAIEAAKKWLQSA